MAVKFTYIITKYIVLVSYIRIQRYIVIFLQVSKEAKLDIDEEEYVQKFVPAMMDVVNAWCKGHTFAQICKVSNKQSSSGSS